MPSPGPAWKSWLDAALSFLYPEVCQLCGVERAGAEQGYVCVACRSHPGAVRWIEPPFCQCCGLPHAGDISVEYQCGNCEGLELQFKGARASVAATDWLLQIVHRYKYGKQLWLEPFLVELLLQQAVPHIRVHPSDVIVPVPLHPAKLREREFNQSERLAHHLSVATGLPMDARCVSRVRPTRTQTALDRTERAENMRGAFAVHARADLAGKRILLVDDVLTTGATTSACAASLRQAGAREVFVWTLARAI
jgi:ComF family protein